MRTSVLKLGECQGSPRLWLEGRYLEKLGFAPGTRLAVEYDRGKVVVTADQAGARVVSSRRHRPIIDINSKALGDALANASKVTVQCRYGRIEITPAEVETRKASRLQDGSVGSIFSGGGLMDQAAVEAGYTSRFGLEVNPDYADIWQRNHAGEMFCGSIDEIDLARLPPVDLLVGGIPCEPFSSKRRNGVAAEQHPLADLSFWALMAVQRINPRTIVFEEAADYTDSPIGILTMAALRRLGYNVESRIVSGLDYGSLAIRRRSVILGCTGPVRWPEEVRRQRTLAEVLFPANDPRCEWFDRGSKPWLFGHWEKQTSKGNRFASAVLSPTDTGCPAISKRYFNGQGDNPVVGHPDQPGVYRWLDLVEVKRLMGLPDHYDLGDAKTVAGHVMGQGVLVDVFRRIIEAVAPQGATVLAAA